MGNLDYLIRKRQKHLEERIHYIQTKLQQESSSHVYQFVLDRLNLVDDHSKRINEILILLGEMPQFPKDPTATSCIRAAFYDQIFSRLQEVETVVSVLDGIWSDYIISEDFAKKFSVVSRIFSQFCDEISEPLGPSFCMILPGDRFGYLRYTNVARNLFRVFVPISAVENPHAWPILAHEIGHAFSFLPTVEERIEMEYGPLISRQLKSIRERIQRSREDFADIEYVLSRSWYQWVSEIWADLFALRRLGPCLIDSEMSELMAFDPFSLGTEPSGRLFTSSHPPPDIRMKLLLHYSIQWFPRMSSHTSALQELWNEIVSNRTSTILTEHREVFDLLCDSQLLRSMEQKAVNLLNQLVPIREVPALTYKTFMRTHPINVTGALSSFLCEGEEDANFIEDLGKGVRLAS